MVDWMVAVMDNKLVVLLVGKKAVVLVYLMELQLDGVKGSLLVG